jgi:hypothetical protein
VAQAQHAGQSQRAAVASAGVARGTLRHWNTSAETSVAAPAGLVAFCETPEGVEWLRRVQMAAHWSISEQGGAGVRVVCQFLEFSGLSAFIGASYGTQQAFQAELERQVVSEATDLCEALAKTMPHRTLSVAEDETWQDGMRLVAIERSPTSSFSSRRARRARRRPGARRWSAHWRGSRSPWCKASAMRPRDCWPMSNATRVPIIRPTYSISSMR